MCVYIYIIYISIYVCMYIHNIYTIYVCLYIYTHNIYVLCVCIYTHYIYTLCVCILNIYIYIYIYIYAIYVYVYRDIKTSSHIHLPFRPGEAGSEPPCHKAKVSLWTTEAPNPALCRCQWLMQPAVLSSELLQKGPLRPRAESCDVS